MYQLYPTLQPTLSSGFSGGAALNTEIVDEDWPFKSTGNISEILIGYVIMCVRHKYRIYRITDFTCDDDIYSNYTLRS